MAWLTLVLVVIGWWDLGSAGPQLAQAGLLALAGFHWSQFWHDPGLVDRACRAMALLTLRGHGVF